MSDPVRIPPEVIQKIEDRVLALHYQVLADATKSGGRMTKHDVHNFASAAAERFRNRSKED